jgi:hypothetical protein
MHPLLSPFFAPSVLPTDPYALYTGLNMLDIPWHAGAGAWGVQESLVAPTLPNITNGETVVTNEAQFNAARGNGKRIIVDAIITPGFAFGINGYTDLEIVINDGCGLNGPIYCNAGTRIRICGETAGITGTGLITGEIDLAGAGAVNDFTLDGVGLIGRLVSGGTQVINRLACLRVCLRATDGHYLPKLSDAVFAGCNMLGETNWMLRMQNTWRRVVVFECHIETDSNAMFRAGAALAADSPSGSFWVGDSTLANSTQNHASATGEIMRADGDPADYVQNTGGVFIDNCRIHANRVTTNTAEIQPSGPVNPLLDSYCHYYRHTDGLVVNDLPWNAAAVEATARLDDDWNISTTVVPTSGNAIPGWSDRNASGDPNSL